MGRIQENIIDYSIGDRIKSLLIIASNILLRYKSLPIKNIDGKEVINWFLEALLNEISLSLNVTESTYMKAVKEFVNSAEKAFLAENIEEAVESISNAISKATTQAGKAFEELENVWKTIKELEKIWKAIE
ncbi:MAG: hypothetical protein ACFFA5_09010 [Promethearchaeota archaeon]